ncbi:ABC transporter ATP-binding protein [Streptomyces sp. HD]|uniref:ABC transporter ATP-binding protein n=1 Tax=Streptomyces sp. HD TaxID=3020892 RepID=UPI00232A81F3|nr:ABC transporter ATP-binding protein [Streptomyces sp. HD]MDC0766348.1 ABC transporter ATP-binding protein [Streptomyces sp. HD]
MGLRAPDRLLLSTARHGGVWVGVTMLMALLLTGASLALPAVMGRTVDAVLSDGDITRWLSLSGLLIFVLVTCEAVDDLVGQVAEARSTAWLRHTLLGHVLGLGTRATRRFTPGDLVSRLVGNAARTGNVASGLVWVVMGLVPPLGAIVALALIDYWLCLTFLAGMPLVVLLVRAFLRDISDANEGYFRVQGRIAARLTDALGGIRTITAAGTVDREARRVLAPLPELRRHGLSMWNTVARVSASGALVVPLLEVAVLAVAGLALSQGRITAGDVLAASEYVVMAAGIGDVMSSLNQLAQARATAARIAEVVAEPPVSYGNDHLPEGSGRLEFRHVTMRGAGGTGDTGSTGGTGSAGDQGGTGNAGGKGTTGSAGGKGGAGGTGGAVLSGLDLVVPGGALVAVVGRSGSGKSLLAALAGRLVDPDEGEVRLDGVPLRRLRREELRRAVGYGFERPVLLGETFADAIGFGPRTASAQELTAGARAARADAFIRHMPAGYGSRVADTPISGGEAQRVGLARAFVQAGRVLILDDVAASLDTVTEHHISQVLTGALADRTRIVVTHRASTAARADLVVWLADGSVRGRGTHRALWADPAYRAAFQADGGGVRCDGGRSGSFAPR